MNGTGYSLLAGGALVALLPSVWGYVRAIYQNLSGRLVVRAVYRDCLADAVSYYLSHCMKASKWGVRDFTGSFFFVRPLLRRALVAFESPGADARLFWLGWKPVIASRQKSGDGNPNAILCNPLTVCFIRGTFDPEQLAVDASEKYNSIRRAGGSSSRYFIRFMSGTDGEMNVNTQGGVYPNAPMPVAAENNAMLVGGRILHWRMDEIGDSDTPGVQMERLALPEHVQSGIASIEHWYRNERWYRERGIPWKRGCLFHGVPGTGKTATVRALAHKLDMPVFVFDLSTLRNRELRSSWSECRGCAPCIALFEDIDCVFDGRKNVAGTSLTFDALLNCLDGVQDSSGVLTIVTTNCAEKLDLSLGSVDALGDSSRPGRIDIALEFPPLDETGRLKICKRVLRDWPHLWSGTVARGAQETGAQFQERCCVIACDMMACLVSEGNGHRKTHELVGSNGRG